MVFLMRDATRQMADLLVSRLQWVDLYREEFNFLFLGLAHTEVNYPELPDSFLHPFIRL